jgi:tripartite-type tricarboxylate transporter receptor subunit TctC
MKKACVALLLFTIVLSSAFTAAQAEVSVEDYPNRSILMIVPFGPGGATDQLARVTQKVMEKELGQPFTVQNMAGGGTSIGTQYLMDQKHDGYTVMAAPTDIVSIGVMGQSKFTYKDLSYLGIGVSVPAVFLVNPNSDIQTLEDLVAAMKAEKLTAAVADAGCAWTRSTALLCNETGVQLPEFVPSGGGYNAAVAAMKGDVDFACCGFGEAMELIKGKELRALAYWGSEEFTMPDGSIVPNASKIYPQLQQFDPFGGWVGFAVPADTPKAIQDKLTAAYKTALADPSFDKFCETQVMFPVKLFGEDAQAYVEKSSRVNAYMLYDLGFAKIDPATLGLERL